MKRVVLLIIIFTNLGVLQSFSQDCNYLFGSMQIDDGIIRASEIQAGNIPSNPDIPVLSKIDFNGVEEWRIQNNIGAYYNLSYMWLYDFSDDYFYTLLRINDTHHNSLPNLQVWKVAKQDGQIVWKTPIYRSLNGGTRLINYDGNQIVLYHSARDATGFQVLTIDKQTGADTIIHEDSLVTGTQMVKDSKGNMILTYLKRETNYNSPYVLSIRKVNGLNFRTPIWEKIYDNGFGNTSLETVSRMIVDELDDLYVFSGENSIDFFKIDSNTGDEIWSINNIASGKVISDLLFDGSHLYMSLSHRLVGSVITDYEMVKIDLNTATTIWHTRSDMDTVGDPTSGNGGNEAIMEFALDCNGFIYANGYYGSANWAPGAWGIIKIDSNDGAKISDITITNDPDNYDTLSVGLDVYVNGEEIIFLGNIQTSSTDSNEYLVKTNTDLEISSTSDLCARDYDNDGVMDVDDDCPLLSGTSSNNGCPLDLPHDNFSIETLGETCVNQDNAQIIINATTSYDYEATLTFNGTPINIPNNTFTNNLTIGDLSSGSYELCIHIPLESYVQCFNLELVQPMNLTGSSNTSEDNLYNLDLTGATTYTVQFNDEQFILNAPTETTSVTFSQPLTELVNTVTVTTEKACQGSFEETITLNSDNLFTVFPNPFDHTLQISLISEDTLGQLNIYDINGKLVLKKEMILPMNNVKVDMSKLSSGIYILELTTNKEIFRKRLIKE